MQREWIPIAEAMKLLRMTRHGIKRRARMVILETSHLGSDPQRSPLWVNRKQVEQQALDRPNYARRTEWLISAEEGFLIWFAGFFDGEGCIGIRADNRPKRRSWHIQLTLPNTYFAAIEAIEQNIGGRVHRRRPQTDTRKETRVWDATCGEAVAMTPSMPRLVIVGLPFLKKSAPGAKSKSKRCTFSIAVVRALNGASLTRTPFRSELRLGPKRPGSNTNSSRQPLSVTAGSDLIQSTDPLPDTG